MQIESQFMDRKLSVHKTEILSKIWCWDCSDVFLALLSKNRGTSAANYGIPQTDNGRWLLHCFARLALVLGFAASALLLSVRKLATIPYW